MEKEHSSNSGTYNVTKNELSSEDIAPSAISQSCTTHGYVPLQTGNYVGSLLLLIKSDKGVECQDAHNDTEIDPV